MRPSVRRGLVWLLAWAVVAGLLGMDLRAHTLSAWATPADEQPTPPALEPSASTETGPSGRIAAMGTELVRPDWVSAQVSAAASGKRVEVLSARTQTARSWVNPDGTVSAEEAAAPVRFERAGAGADGWVDIHTTLVKGPEILHQWEPILSNWARISGVRIPDLRRQLEEALAEAQGIRQADDQAACAYCPRRDPGKIDDTYSWKSAGTATRGTDSFGRAGDREWDDVLRYYAFGRLGPSSQGSHFPAVGAAAIVEHGGRETHSNADQERIRLPGCHRSQR